jgi:hypothetical protein
MTRAWHDSPLPLQVASAVRGPVALRDDIADEIADHLASRVEEQDRQDPAAAQAEAVRAFGNPEQIARELRAVHLGDWIMFQKLMVVALIVIVAGMAASSYFSYTATRAMSTQMADVTRETGRQFNEVAKQLAALSNVQLANQPPRIKVYCYTVGPEQPARDYALLVESMDMADPQYQPKIGGTFANSYRTDSAGWIDTGPLPLGVYRLSGNVLCPGSEPNVPDGKLTHVVRVPQNGITAEVRFCVGTRARHGVRLVLPPEITWDLEAMKAVDISFKHSVGPRVLRNDTETWESGTYSVDLAKPVLVVGLMPGIAKPTLTLPASLVGKGTSSSSMSSHAYLKEVQIPTEPQPIALQPAYVNTSHVSGLVYDSSRDKPVVRARITVLHRLGKGVPEKIESREFLRTDASGRFGSFFCSPVPSIEFEWKAADGTQAILSGPYGVRRQRRRFGCCARMPRG